MVELKKKQKIRKMCLKKKQNKNKKEKTEKERETERKQKKGFLCLMANLKSKQTPIL